MYENCIEWFDFETRYKVHNKMLKPPSIEHYEITI